jgi:hypothetical protein
MLGVLGVIGLLVALSLAVARPALGAMIHADDNENSEDAKHTRLLYSFVANGFGVTTSLTLTNTSADPFGTEPKGGTCTITFYGNGEPPQPVVFESMNPGTLEARDVTQLTEADFAGYAVADCDFPFARGVAFVHDDNNGRLNLSYPAEIIGNDRHAP